MSSDSLVLTPDSLVVFIDETGAEDYRDPKNPTFGAVDALRCVLNTEISSRSRGGGSSVRKWVAH